jgi:hypothetical protein
MTARALVALGFALLGLSPQTGQPVRPVPGGTGVITGTVTSTSTGTPIRSARVNLTGTSAGTRTALTDGRGRFSFTALPPGRVLIAVAHDNFLTTNYGQKKPGRPGTPVDLADAQRIDVNVRMGRGSVITGTAFDEYGDPLVRIRVRALRYLVNQNGVRRLRVVNEVRTDDRGIYRFFNLEPGDYLVAATPVSPDTIEPGPGMADATATELALTADVDVSLAPFRPVGSSDDGSPGAADDGYAPTYYPASITAARALSISVDGTAEHAGVDIRVLPVRTGSIRGTVVGMPGPSVSVQVLLHSTDAAEEATTLTAGVGEDGAFTLIDVAPGAYMVYAQTMPLVSSDAGSAIQAVRMASFDRLHGRVAVTVDGPDTPPVAIALRPGRSISGRVVLDLAQPPSAAAASAGTTISITPAPQPAGLPAFNTSPQVHVGADGLFTLPGIRPGRYFLRASGPGTVRSVMWSGTDTLDFPLEVTSELDISGVVIRLTDRPSEVSGSVTDAAGKPNNDCTVLAVSTDSRFWSPGSRRVMMAQPEADGRYSFRGLPAGEYRLAVLSDFDPVSRFDVSFLRQLAGMSVTVTVTEGGKHLQSMRLAR